MFNTEVIQQKIENEKLNRDEKHKNTFKFTFVLNEVQSEDLFVWSSHLNNY